MTDLPYGRGGSPLQNLIINKKYETKISAIRVSKEIDAGDVYLKTPFNIGLGSAEEIYSKVSKKIYEEMIPFILNNMPKAKKQKGTPIFFKRRNPEQSNLHVENINDILSLYDFIRMLDAEGYPNAFIKYNNFKISFSEVHLKNKKLIGRFEIIYDEK